MHGLLGCARFDKSCLKSNVGVMAVQRLNAWTSRAVGRGPHEHTAPMLIYVCCVRHVFNVLAPSLLEVPMQCLILSTNYIFIV